MTFRGIIGFSSKGSKRCVQGLLLLAGLAAQACPMFSAEPDCWYDGDCAPGFLCDRRNGTCFPEPAVEREPCSEPADCRAGETCNPNAICVPGDCTFSGCITGYVCGVMDGRWSCLAKSGAAGGMGGQAGSPGAAGLGGL